MTAFHDKTFDNGTRLKLELFRGYIREWIPTFFTKSIKFQTGKINFYDFFSGPGTDTAGNLGSPLIIIEELKKYCSTNSKLKAEDVEVNMFFNDVTHKNIAQLKGAVESKQCTNGCCSFHYSNHPFAEALDNELRGIEASDTASLVIMDQFGVKEVTPQVLRKLASCRQTDILFFISSAFIKRFIDTPEFAKSFKDVADDVKNSEYKVIHRVICEHYREQVEDGYYLAPFSIKKGANIYGVIFGSGNLRGLEKFLKVCWALDPVTGEANFDIDDDVRARSPQRSLWKEMETVKKIDVFRSDLEEYIASNTPSNNELYEFSLVSGFPPAKTAEALRSLQNVGKLSVTEYNSGLKVKKGAFYLSYRNYKDSPKAKFEIR